MTTPPKDTTERDELADLERFYLERIEEIRLAYVKAAKPYIDKVIEIRNMRPMPQIIMVANAYMAEKERRNG